MTFIMLISNPRYFFHFQGQVEKHLKGLKDEINNYSDY